MMKKISLVLLVIAILLAPSATLGNITNTEAAENNAITVSIFGTKLKLSTPARIVQGTTMLPLRTIAEALGAEVDWKPGKQGKDTITLIRHGKSAKLTIKSKSIQSFQGQTVSVKVAPYVKNRVTYVPLRAISELLGVSVDWDANKRIAYVGKPADLPVVGSVSNLKSIFAKADQTNNSLSRFRVGVVGPAMVSEPVAASAKSESAADASTSSSGSDVSQTNVQVEGVDEADWAKIDGKYIFQVSGSRIVIADISNRAAPKVAATLNYAPEEEFYPQELYIDGNRLIVIGHRNLPMQIAPAPESSSQGKVGAASPSTNARMAIWIPTRSSVKTMVYELDSSGKPTLVRETEIEGNYLSSRKIGSAIYIVANKYNHSYLFNNPELKGVPVDDEFKPLYRDTAGTGKMQSLPLTELRYFPDSPEYNTLMIGAFDINKPDQEIQVSAYLGSSSAVYASAENLYLAVGKYKFERNHFSQDTQVYKFRMFEGKVTYVAEGTVPGGILNQFSMDEHQGYFRIATTTGNMWASGEDTSKNNIYVLSEGLERVGTLEGLAPGERIYSARFMGSRAYMVTFRTVDPLFVIDLREPSKPTVLGELKIPGYSDYLHPYDENHLIGFGKETIEVSAKGWGRDETIAVEQGMKIALFDVTDVNNPKEKFKEKIGDRGTHSELLYNHKAFLFSKEKNIMAFPVDLMEISDKQKAEENGFPAYGQFTFQGAYIYGIDLQKGFQLRGRITHLSEDEYAKSLQYGYDYTKTVRRILYAGDTLYTLSEGMLKANELPNLAELGSLEYFPKK